MARATSMTKIHLDTDIGGDMDDVCALAMLLKWPDLQITGVTTVSDQQGRRAGYVQYVLSLVERTDIPCAAGADVSGGYYRYELGYPPDEENWPEPITPRPGSPDKAVSLLKRRRRRPLTSSHGDEGGVPFWSGVAGHRSEPTPRGLPR